MQKNKGFSLIELLIVLGIIAVLSSFITPKFMNYLAKGKETKAIATLQSLRTASEFYYLENGENFIQNKQCGEITPEQFKNLENFLSSNSKLLLKNNKIKVEIGGSRTEKSGKIKYGGDISFTTKNPDSDKNSDGINIWFNTTGNSIGEYNIGNNKWTDL